MQKNTTEVLSFKGQKYTYFISICYLIKNLPISFNIFIQSCCREDLLININCLTEEK